MRILAIETSCDETGVAIVEAKKEGDAFVFTVLGSALLSQAALHAEYGGVFPNLAKREHEKNLPVILMEAIEKTRPGFVRKNGLAPSSAKPEDLFSANPGVVAVAVTQGPGLEPALWTGVEFAKKLALAWKVPLFPVNHMEGHLISSLIQDGKIEGTKFPVLGLLVSGGHTEFVLMHDWFKYEIIGKTLDDAVGEAFDKVARMLNLTYPGGPEISKHARVARDKNLISEKKLPRPMIATDNCDVSFSGLKTAALYTLRDRGGIQTLTAEDIQAFSREFEDAVTDVLVAKTKRALEQTGAQTFVLGGGVAANTHIRQTLESVIKKDFSDVGFRLPELAITGDNAIMIAEAALMHFITENWRLESPPSADFRAVGNLSIAS